eukprot:CAMPEP_0196651442 /NCGR_PEP_ID=MMETSP1086-20130531/394_1 /TAXON_ID=77921 /ORGANISM="Cyanoptyche  gloeocystis , Strain SAG4.97" /LENGTH=235 /DNA_ID=CAMNT_0041981441 /DNA_START=120 /DNA_END=827 /DNA_ORIENTATION=+
MPAESEIDSYCLLPSDQSIPKKPFFFLRHGQTDWNRADGLRLQGHQDTELNDTGKLQADRAGDVLRTVHFLAVYSSPLKRALETARIVLDAGHGTLPLHTDDGLREQYFGPWEGRYVHEIAHELGFNRSAVSDISVLAGYVPESAESEYALTNRVRSTLQRILAEPGPVLIVSHSGFLRVTCRILGLENRYRQNATPLFFSPDSVAKGWTVELAGMQYQKQSQPIIGEIGEVSLG